MLITIVKNLVISVPVLRRLTLFSVTALSLTGLVMTLPNTAFAAMYKQIDKDGNVTYTDVPDKANIKPIKPAPIMTFSAPTGGAVTFNPSAGADGDDEDGDGQRTSAISYQSLSISSPENGAAVRANGGTITVQLTLDPPLDSNNKHRIVLLMDGQTKAEGQSSSFTLNAIDRGEHTLSARVESADGKTLITASGVTFQVLRAGRAN